MHVHGVVYANNLPLNHNITVHPATQEHRFIDGVAKQRLLLPWLRDLCHAADDVLHHDRTRRATAISLVLEHLSLT